MQNAFTLAVSRPEQMPVSLQTPFPKLFVPLLVT